VVTVTIDSVHFLAPAFAHDTLVMSARVNAAFGSSLEIEVVVEVEDLIKGTRRACCTGRFVFVHLDDQTLKPRTIPGLRVETEEEEEREQAAILRKKERAAERKGLATNGEELRKWNEHWPRVAAVLKNLNNDIEMVNASDSASSISKVILPQHANTLNIAFGGQVMAWMEQAAAIAASRLTRQNVIVVGLDRMAFQKASKVGDLLTFKAKVTRVFSKSLEVHVQVFTYSGGISVEPEWSNDGYFTFTTVDEKQCPIAVGKQVLPANDEEKKDFCEANWRREARLHGAKNK